MFNIGTFFKRDDGKDLMDKIMHKKIIFNLKILQFAVRC